MIPVLVEVCFMVQSGVCLGEYCTVLFFLKCILLLGQMFCLHQLGRVGWLWCSHLLIPADVQRGTSVLCWGLSHSSAVTGFACFSCQLQSHEALLFDVDILRCVTSFCSLRNLSLCVSSSFLCSEVYFIWDMYMWIDTLFKIKKKLNEELPGSSVVKTFVSTTGGLGLIPDQGTKILQTTQNGHKWMNEYAWCISATVVESGISHKQYIVGSFFFFLIHFIKSIFLGMCYVFWPLCKYFFWL